MANVIKIDGIEYPGYIENEPDQLCYEKDIEKKRYFYRIFEEDYENIPKNDIIYYNIDKDIYKSGRLLKYIDPNIFILCNKSLLYIWSIQLEDDTIIYVKDYNKIRRDNKLKEDVFREYMRLQGNVTSSS